MRSPAKAFLCVVVACFGLAGFAFYPERPGLPATITERPRSAVEAWALQSMAELAPVVAGTAAVPRREAEYSACVRRVQDDYSDDPAEAYGWIRTLCHR
jgi:hypothetical protein